MTMTNQITDPLNLTIGGVRPPDSKLARAAVDLARSVSTPMLFNHVMRSYLFAELRAQAELGAYDREVVLVSSVLHDLGLTDHARGPRRFEIESADAARQFALAGGFPEEKAWLVWDNIALHPLDLNPHKEPEAKAVQWGLWADVVGIGIDRLDPNVVIKVVASYPRLGFKRGFFELLRDEAEAKPQSQLIHPATMVAHHCLGGVTIPDARALIDRAPFDE
jgi:hypothetical protein